MYPLVTQLNFLPILSKEKLAQVRNLMSPQRLQMYRSVPRVRSSSGTRRRPLIKDILSETRRVGFIWKTLLTTPVRETPGLHCQTRAETYLLYWVVEAPKPPRSQLSSPCRLDPAIVMEPPALIPAESRCVDETETRRWSCSNVILLLAMSFFFCFFPFFSVFDGQSFSTCKTVIFPREPLCFWWALTEFWLLSRERLWFGFELRVFWCGWCFFGLTVTALFFRVSKLWFCNWS